MKLTKLVIRNFMSVTEATLYLADKGLVSIEGVNLDETGSDSNGAGKSTIINAILWCNYGEAGKSIKADSVVSKKAKKDCSVECTWQDEKQTYRITRYRKHKTEKNAVRVELLHKEEASDITKAGATNVQAQIDEILGQDYLTFQASCFAQQDESLDIPAMTDKGLKELLEKVLPFEDLNEQYEVATKSANAAEDNVNSIKRDKDKALWNLEEAKKNGIDAVNKHANYKTEVAEANKAVENKITAKKEDIKVASHGLSDISSLEKVRVGLKEAIDKLGDTNVRNATTELIFATSEHKKWKEMYDSPDTSCALCKQETESKEAYRARLLPNLRNLKDAMEKASLKYDEVKANDKKCYRLEQELQDINDRIEAHLNAEKTIARLRSEIKLLEGQKTVAGANPHLATVQRFKTAYEGAKADLKRLDEELVEAEATLELAKAVQHTFSPKGVRYHMLESVAPNLTEYTNYYLNMLTDGAMKAVWSTVTKTTTGEFREKFKIDVYMDGEEIEYGAISGGEKRKVRLACFFGLQDLIAKRATKNIELWCGDEIDHALDAAGVERLMSVLAAKTASKSSILVISHNQLRDWIPNYVVVTRKDKNSTITGYLNAN